MRLTIGPQGHRQIELACVHFAAMHRFGRELGGELIVHGDRFAVVEFGLAPESKQPQ